ncbi:MAG: hypothetical protein IKP32_06930 [Clostridia bacterium]|nr:hypothetical protein [Clostridia bacterium]
MSVATAKKKSNNQPALTTTGRGAAFCVTLGIVCLSLGMIWVVACLAAAPGSRGVLAQLSDMVKGLGGRLYSGLPALMIVGGAMLLVSCRHRVSARNFLMVAAIYWLALAGYTLIAQVSPQGGITLSYLEHVGSQTLSTGLNAYLQGAYRHGTSGTGGMLGMLLAYPLWRTIGRVGSILLVTAALITLILVLFRLNPGALFRSASDLGEKRRRRKLEKSRQRAARQQAQAIPQAGEPVYQDQTARQPAEAPAPPAYYQPAPVYEANPVCQTPQPDAQGFYPVQPDLYDERFPLHDETAEAQPPVATPQPAVDGYEPGQKHISLMDKLRRMRQAAPLQQPKNDSAVSPSARPAPLRPVHAARPTGAAVPVAPRRDTVQPAAAMPVQPAQALDDDGDDVPWEVPETAHVPKQTVPKQDKAAVPAPAAPEPVRASVPAPAIPAPADAKNEATAEKKADTSGSWAAQVRDKAAKLQQELPEHTTQKGEPKPVYTDPVMPITGAKIPIKPAPAMKELDRDQRLDGTTAPMVKQEKMDLSVPYQAPPIRLLKEARHVLQSDAAQEDERRAQVIEGTLRSFGVDSEVKQIMHGPSITRFAIQIAPGVKVSRVANTADNLALELKTQHVRVEAPIQGTNYIGIEVPNQLVSTVSLREVLDSPEMKSNPSPLLVALGKDIAGAPVLCDLSKMPHLLIAGATGSGKSVCINSIVCSLLYRTSPDQVRLIMVDPKQVELSVYNGIPHLLVPVVSDPRKAAGALSWVVQEMFDRYGKFSAQSVRNITGYNKANQGTDQVLPNIVVIIDEMADLMEVCRKDVEESIRRLAALARAAGIYMVLATQRPSVDVITGVIKNNIPSRIAFAVSSGTDSRTIIDINGAEKLMGKGDMLYKPTGTSPVRVQGCFVSDEEVGAITEYISSRYQADYDPNIVDHLENTGKDSSADEITGGNTDDEGSAGGEGSFSDLLQQAIEMAVEDGQSSTSMLQRRLRIGYARAGRLIDEMEKRGIISHSEGSKPRKTLVTREQYYEMMQDQ